MRLDAIKIRTELYKQGMTQKDLVERSGYSRSAISGVCNGRSCQIHTAKAIAKALGVTVDDLK